MARSIGQSQGIPSGCGQSANSAKCPALARDILKLVVDYTAALRSLNEFPMTLTDDSAIAAAAMTGDNTSPKVG